MIRLNLESLIEFGRTIGIICRDIVRNFILPGKIIACSNLRVGLKSKDNSENRWCCYWTDFTLPRVNVRSWLKKLWQRCHTKLFSISEFKRFGSWWLTTTLIYLDSTYILLFWSKIRKLNKIESVDQLLKKGTYPVVRRSRPLKLERQMWFLRNNYKGSNPESDPKSE